MFHYFCFWNSHKHHCFLWQDVLFLVCYLLLSSGTLLGADASGSVFIFLVVRKGGRGEIDEDREVGKVNAESRRREEREMIVVIPWKILSAPSFPSTSLHFVLHQEPHANLSKSPKNETILGKNLVSFQWGRRRYFPECWPCWATCIWEVLSLHTGKMFSDMSLKRLPKIGKGLCSPMHGGMRLHWKRNDYKTVHCSQSCNMFKTQVCFIESMRLLSECCSR